MAYQADHLTKNKILEVLGPEQLFRLELLFLCLLIICQWLIQACILGRA